MKNVAIDLTWVRHQKVGGTEAYVVNLLDGFAALEKKDLLLTLLVAEDNQAVFAHYAEYVGFRLLVCPVLAANKPRRVLWQNFRMGRLLRKNGISVCLEPVYLKPFLNFARLRYITTIHDLQAAHYPQYFSKARVLWMKMCWANTVRTSAHVVGISEYVRNDILSRYHVSANRVSVIYDPVIIQEDDVAPLAKLAEFGAEAGNYYYLVSSLLPHKNIETAIRALGELKKANDPAYAPFFISGVGSRDPEALLKIAREYGIESDIHITPFLSNAERNLLYQNCKVFLFPSLFEGFGMTPLEAMMFGAPVLSSKESCTYETTGGLANYVDCATDPMEWKDRISHGVSAAPINQVREWVARYSPEKIAAQFVELIDQILK